MAERKRFNEEAVERAQELAIGLCRDVPELDGVAIVLSYEIRNPELPHTILVGPDGPMTSPSAIVHMGQQLYSTMSSVLDKGYKCIQELDSQMGAQKKVLMRELAEIELLQKQIQEGRAACHDATTRDRT